MKKVGGVIVSHGQVANELLAAAETIVGEMDHIAAISIGWHDDVESAKDEIERAIERVSQGAGILIMTDMFGGTPTNIAAMFMKENEVEIITGVNLPMVIKLAAYRKEAALDEVARDVEAQGKNSIERMGALLGSPKAK